MTRKAASATFLCLLTLGLAGFVPISVDAGEPSWANVPYKYIVIDQDIADTLKEFGRNLKISTNISPAVAGRRIRGSIGANQDLTALAFLQNLCDSYGLVWYFDGAALNVAADDEVKTELFKLDGVKSTEILREVNELGLSYPRFNIRAANDSTMLSVSGPPSYRALIRDIVSKLDNNNKMRPIREIKLEDDAKVRVFRGG